MLSTYLYKDYFKVVFPGLFFIGLIGLFIDPAIEMYLTISVLGLLSLIILTERWHKRDPALTMLGYALLISLLIFSLLNHFGIAAF